MEESTQRRSSSSSRTSRCLEAYQISFTCSHIGRYVAGSKRKISWRFGLMDSVCLESSRDGQPKSVPSGQDHEMHLIWSVQSKKSRVVWNNTDITSLISSGNKATSTHSHVEYAWEGSMGMKFRIVAHANPSPGRRQYDLFICEKSFVSLPQLSQVLSRDYQSHQIVSANSKDCHEQEEKTDVPVKFSLPRVDSRSRLRQSSRERPLTPQRQNRLAAAGFSCVDSFDELQSDLYSSSLDRLRAEMALSVPQTEDMVSRAIVDAFAEDHENIYHSVLSTEEYELDPTKFEAEVLWETKVWVENNGDFNDLYAEESRLRYMREQVNCIVSHVRHQRLSAADAAVILRSIAAILDLNISKPLQRNTVIVSGLSNDVNCEDMIAAMQEFGCIQRAALVEGQGAGICRYGSSLAVSLALKAANQNQLTILNSKPTLCDLNESDSAGMLDSRNDSTSGQETKLARRTRSDERPLSPLRHLFQPTEQDVSEFDALTPHRRSFPFYETKHLHHRSSDETPGAQVLSPSERTTSTTSSVEVDDLHVLSLRVPE